MNWESFEIGKTENLSFISIYLVEDGFESFLQSAQKNYKERKNHDNYSWLLYFCWGSYIFHAKDFELKHSILNYNGGKA